MAARPVHPGGSDMLSAAKTCLVCRFPLPSHPGRTGGLCDDPHCRWKYAATPSSHRCTVCGRLLDGREVAARVCSDRECQRVWLEKRAHEHADRERDRVAALTARAGQLRDDGAEAAGVRDPRSYPLVLIAGFDAPLIPPSEDRRAALRDHVAGLVRQALAGEEGEPEKYRPPVDLTPEVAAVFGRACASCRGHCCRGGAERAYLSVATIRRYLEANPGREPDEVAAAYLDRVPGETHQGSCIYHGADGCGLAREMRSDTCNRYYCDGLLDFREQLAADGPVRGFFAVGVDAVRSAAFLDEDGSRAVPVTADG